MSKIIEGNLPLIVENQNTEKIKNYQIYGTASGAGVETENLFDYAAQNENNGYRNNAYLSKFNTLVSSNVWEVSEFLPLEPDTEYYLYWDIDTTTAVGAGFYDENKDIISNFAYSNRKGYSFVADDGRRFVRFSVSKVSEFRPLIGLYVQKDNLIYEPYGYKLPLTVESGEESTTTPIYIGDSKLMAEEYVDYENGKVWKQRDNLFDAEQIVEDSISTASTYIKDGWLHYNTGPNPITINVDGQVGETFQFKLYIKNFSTVSSNNIRFILHYSDETSVITASNSYAAGISRYAQFASNPNKELVSVVSQNTSNRNAGIEISKSLIVKSDTMPETYLNPTDPPVTLPTLSLYKGTNTLSSTTELGKVILDYSVPEIFKVQLENQLYDLIDRNFYNIIANSYNSSLTYNEGDYCIYNYQLYKCISAISIPEDFDSEKWSQVTLAESLRGD